ncbi:hypothetical protein L1887_18768 [Cichorium endivia]|nr:hypothetical protein L1887_18768 [Cichorium endivia]
MSLTNSSRLLFVGFLLPILRFPAPNGFLTIERALGLIADALSLLALPRDADDRSNTGSYLKFWLNFGGISNSVMESDKIEASMASQFIREWSGIQQFPPATQDKLLQLLGKLKEKKKDRLTILVMGKGGVGKSSTVNSIIGERAVAVSAFQSEALRPSMVSRERSGFTLNIIDTPGIVEGGYVNDQALDIIKRFLLNKTIDVLLYVDRLDAYRVDTLDRQIVKAISNSFGKEIWRRAIVVLTHAQFSPPDCLTFDEFLAKRSESLLKVVYHGARFTKEDIQSFSIPVGLVENSNKNEKDEKKLVLVDLEDVVDDHSGKNATMEEVVVEQTNLDEGNVVVDDHSGKNANVEEVVVEQTNMNDGNAVVDDHSGKNAIVEEVVDEGNAVVDDHSGKNAIVEEVVDEENASVDEVVVEDNETLDEGVNEHTLDDFEFFDPLFGDQYEEQHHNEQVDFQNQIHEHSQEVDNGHQIEEDINKDLDKENEELVDEENNVPELEVDMRDFRDILETNVGAIGTEGVTDIGVVEGEVEVIDNDTWEFFR